MPRLPRKRNTRRVKYVTASTTGSGSTVKTFVGSAADRFTDTLKARPSRLISPPRRPRGGDNRDEHRCQWDDSEASGVPSVDWSFTEKEDFPVIIRKRNKPSERQALARNWRTAEKNIVSLLLGEQVQPECQCLQRESVDVRFVSCEGRYRQSGSSGDPC
jgi:hypothetical protein